MTPTIHLKLEGEGAFDDLAESQVVVVHLTGPFTIATLEKGMTSGRPSLALRFDLDDGTVVIQETSVAAFLTAAAAIRGKFGG